MVFSYLEKKKKANLCDPENMFYYTWKIQLNSHGNEGHCPHLTDEEL